MKKRKVACRALLALASLSMGLSVACGHAGTTAPPPTTAKGYPTPTPTTAPPAPPPAAVAQTRSSAPPPAPPPPPPPATPITQPVTLAPPRRVYEPPMPLEPGKSNSVYQPLPAGNGPNTTATGQRFSVRGVDPSDVLNIRSGPSATHEIVGTIPPDGNGVVPLGGRRQIGPSVWREVSYRGVRGWVNDRFLVDERENQQR